MTNDAVPVTLEVMDPKAWFDRDASTLWQVFGYDFKPDVDGFADLAMLHTLAAHKEGIYLHAPHVADYLVWWWRSVRLTA